MERKISSIYQMIHYINKEVDKNIYSPCLIYFDPHTRAYSLIAYSLYQFHAKFDFTQRINDGNITQGGGLESIMYTMI